MQSLVCAEVLQCLMVSVADSRQSLKGARAAVRSSRTWIHCVFDFELILLIGHSETCYHCQTFSDPSVVAPRGVTAHGLRRVLTEEASLQSRVTSWTHWSWRVAVLTVQHRLQGQLCVLLSEPLPWAPALSVALSVFMLSSISLSKRLEEEEWRQGLWPKWDGRRKGPLACWALF